MELIIVFALLTYQNQQLLFPLAFLSLLYRLRSIMHDTICADEYLQTLDITAVLKEFKRFIFVFINWIYYER